MSGEHPRLWIALRTRTRLIGTLNLALALRGRSSGWGGSGRPRRTFVGFHRGKQPAYHRGIELVLHADPVGGGMGKEWTLFRVPLGKGKSTWLFGRSAS